MQELPIKKLIPIFIVTFLLVFVVFFMVEPYFICEDNLDAIIPECTISIINAEFITGIMIVGVLFLLDMALVYMILGDLMLGN